MLSSHLLAKDGRLLIRVVAEQEHVRVRVECKVLLDHLLSVNHLRRASTDGDLTRVAVNVEARAGSFLEATDCKPALTDDEHDVIGLDHNNIRRVVRDESIGVAYYFLNEHLRLRDLLLGTRQVTGVLYETSVSVHILVTCPLRHYDSMSLYDSMRYQRFHWTRVRGKNDRGGAGRVSSAQCAHCLKLCITCCLVSCCDCLFYHRSRLPVHWAFHWPFQ